MQQLWSCAPLPTYPWATFCGTKLPYRFSSVSGNQNSQSLAVVVVIWWVLMSSDGFTVSQVRADMPTVRAHSSSLVYDSYYFWNRLLPAALSTTTSQIYYQLFGAPLSAITIVTAVRHYLCGVEPRYSQLGSVMCQPHHRQVTLTLSSVNQAAMGWGRKKMLNWW